MARNPNIPITDEEMKEVEGGNHKVEGKERKPAVSYSQLQDKVMLQEQEIEYQRNLIDGLFNFIDKIQNNCGATREQIKLAIANSPMLVAEREAQQPRPQPRPKKPISS